MLTRDTIFEIMDLFQQLVLSNFHNQKLDCAFLPQEVFGLVLDYSGGVERIPLNEAYEVTTKKGCSDLPFCSLENKWLNTNISDNFLECLGINLSRLLERRYAILEIIQGDVILFQTFGWAHVDNEKKQLSFLAKNLPHALRSKNWKYKLHISSEDYYFGNVLNDYTCYPPEVLDLVKQNINTVHFHQYVQSKLNHKLFPEDVEQTVLDMCQQVLHYEPNCCLRQRQFDNPSGFSAFTKDHRVGKFRKKKKASRLKKKRRQRLDIGKEKKMKRDSRRRKAGRVHKRRSCFSY